MRWRAVLLAIALSTPAHADGVYFAESFGVGMARGSLEPTVGRAIQSRLALGARVRWLAIEGFMLANMQTDRDGAWKGLVGGDPAEGRADLEAIGFSIKAIGPIYRAPAGEILEGYLRVGPSVLSANGMLANYRGIGAGASAGIQLTGKVRALGFLWAPLFFVKKGPKVTGSLFLDAGYDFVRLEAPNAPTLDARIGHVSVGFAVGSAF